MPVLYCKNCIWGMIASGPSGEGVKCMNPELEKVQEGNLMPINARACSLYKPVTKGRPSKKG